MAIAKRPSHVMRTVPTVNLDCLTPDSIEQLRDGCKKYGTFYVTSARIEQATTRDLEQCLQHCKSYFAQPEETKMQCVTKDPCFRGYNKQGRLRTAGEKGKGLPDEREYFAMGPAVPSRTHVTQPHSLTAPNIFPNEEVAPGFAPALQDYYQALQEIGASIKDALETMLQVPQGTLKDLTSKKFLTMMVSHYMPAVSDPDSNRLALGAHKDIGLFTMLAIEGDDGLEIFVDNEWMPVAPKPGHLLINLGTTAEKITNGALNGIEHRVNNRSGKDRYSVAAFYSLDNHVRLNPLPGYAQQGDHEAPEAELVAEHTMDFVKKALPEGAWERSRHLFEAVIEDARTEYALVQQGVLPATMVM